MLAAAVDCVSGWLTPTVLIFLVIGTIAVTSKFSAAVLPNHPLSRSPSVVLERFRSFNLYSYRTPDPPAADTATVPAPETLQFDPKPEPEPEPEEPEPEPEDPEPTRIARSQSDTKPAAGEIPTKLAKKMKKSATTKSAFNHFEFEPEEEVHTPERPATMPEREKEDDAEVDAKADDFINRFRQQLNLQRLNSFVRYKEMLNRGN